MRAICLALLALYFTNFGPLFAQTLPSSEEDSISLQPGKSTFFIRANYHAGHVFATTDLLKGKTSTGEPIEKFQALQFEIGSQTYGRKEWQRIYNYPKVGGSLWISNMNDNGELGAPMAGYFFFNGPFHRWGRLSLNYLFGFGLSWNWNQYDAQKNPWNDAIGSDGNAFVETGVALEYRLARAWDVSAGMYLIHASNGAVNLPNAGVNMFAPKAKLAYHFNRREIPEKGLMPKYSPQSEFLFLFSASVRQVKFDSTFNAQQSEGELYENYFMAHGSFWFNRQISYKSKFGLGVDVNYDGAVEADAKAATGDPNYELDAYEKMSVALALNYELIIGKFSVLLGPGYEILRKETPGRAKRFYQRIGVKYYVLDDLFVGTNIRANNFSSARYIEWNLGYRINSGKGRDQKR